MFMSELVRASSVRTDCGHSNKRRWCELNCKHSDSYLGTRIQGIIGAYIRAFVRCFNSHYPRARIYIRLESTLVYACRWVSVYINIYPRVYNYTCLLLTRGARFTSEVDV